jgi:hypothetical protein
MRKLYPWEIKQEKKDGFVQEQLRVEIPPLPPVDSKKEDDTNEGSHSREIVIIDLINGT